METFETKNVVVSIAGSLKWMVYNGKPWKTYIISIDDLGVKPIQATFMHWTWSACFTGAQVLTHTQSNNISDTVGHISILTFAG